MTAMTSTAEIDTTAIEHLLAADPDLFAAELPGETPSERAARRAAAADITSTLLEELAAPMADHPRGLEAGVDAAADTIAEWVDAYADHVHRLVADVDVLLPDTDEVLGRWAA